MTDLSKWDYANEFLLYEAAALIAGIDPAAIYTETKPASDNPQIFDFHEHPLIKPVAERMKLDFLSACDLYLAMHNGHWHHASDEPLPELVLRNREMDAIPLQMGTKFLPLSAETKCALNTWQNSGAWSNYETGKFTRAELIRWILAIGMKSVYPFSMDKRIRLDLEADPDRTPEQWRAHVKEVLEKHNGNKTHAAKELGITRTRVGQLTTTDKVERKPLALSPQDPFGIAKKPVSNRRS